MKFEVGKDHTHREFPPTYGWKYVDPSETSDPNGRFSYWYDELVLDRDNGGQSVLEEHPWLLEDPRFHRDMHEIEGLVDTPNIAVALRIMRVAIELGRHMVEDAEILERRAVVAITDYDIPTLGVLYQSLLDGNFGDRALDEIAHGYIGKHLASTGAVYGQIYARQPDLVADVIPIFAKYYHEYACIEPYGVMVTWRYTNYGPGFETAVSAEWLTEADKERFRAKLT